MKISILTYHDEDNYGATLQAYATYRAIKELGHYPEIINLHMQHRDNIFSKILFSLKRIKFNRFRKKYMPNITRIYNSLEDLQSNPPSSDVYLVGSDQTWNPTISKEYALAYFLDFGIDNQKRVSYASSFGTNSWIDTVYAKKEEIKSLLSRFSTLLVREDKGVEICREIFNVNSFQVVDPVLLFPNYQELTGNVKKNNQLVVYKIVNDPLFYKKALNIGLELGCPVSSVGSLRQIKGIKTRYPESIEKWIKSIASANYIFTDSFHGTVLSLLYHKQFVVYVGDKGKMSRIYSILRLVGLEDRIFSESDSIQNIVDSLQTPIDYKTVDSILSIERNRSLLKLAEAIQ